MTGGGNFEFLATTQQIITSTTSEATSESDTIMLRATNLCQRAVWAMGAAAFLTTSACSSGDDASASSSRDSGRSLPGGGVTVTASQCADFDVAGPDGFDSRPPVGGSEVTSGYVEEVLTQYSVVCELKLDQVSDGLAAAGKASAKSTAQQQVTTICTGKEEDSQASIYAAATTFRRLGLPDFNSIRCTNGLKPWNAGIARQHEKAVQSAIAGN